MSYIVLEDPAGNWLSLHILINPLLRLVLHDFSVAFRACKLAMICFNPVVYFGHCFSYLLLDMTRERKLAGKPIYLCVYSFVRVIALNFFCPIPTATCKKKHLVCDM